MVGERGARGQGSQPSTGRWIAAALAVAVNLGFIAFIVVSVTWQNRQESPVSVELYAPTAPAPKAEAAKAPEPAPPQPEPPKPAPEPPRPAPAPEPPKPQPAPPKPQPEPPKPAPKVEPPAPNKAELALKAKREQVERARLEKEKRETEKREADKRDAEKKKQDEKRLADARERQQREAEALKAQAERERLAAAKATEAAQAKAMEAAQAKAMEEYIRRIQSRIKANVNLPPDIAGNPEAVFDVLQLPTGEIIDVQLRKSSGVRAYDEAVQRAIIKASPLPKPEVADLFRRNLTLKFRPAD